MMSLSWFFTSKWLVLAVSIVKRRMSNFWRIQWKETFDFVNVWTTYAVFGSDAKTILCTITLACIYVLVNMLVFRSL